jgi:hypothetical protein
MNWKEKLLNRARAAGKPPEDFAIEALSETFSSPQDESVRLPRKAWKLEFEALLASMENGNVDADLSRASAYEGRGE